MTLLGKIFTLLLFGLSVAFFVASVAVNASHKDLRTQVADFQTRQKQLETTIDELKKASEINKTQLAQEQVARRVSLAALQTQLETERDKNQQANTQLNDLNSKNTQATQSLAQTLAELKRITSENDILKQEIDKIITDRNAQRRTVIRLTDELNGLASKRTDLQSEVESLRDQSTRFQAMAETRAAALAAAGITDPDDVPPSDLKGVVLAVGADQSVEVSIGRDDGIREGHNLDVYRNGSYLGRIQIRTVADDKAVGKIIPAFRKGFIQAGDKVSAKVY
jgi:predicted  nucleic acid-binding Zn-ribbon protein